MSAKLLPIPAIPAPGKKSRKTGTTGVERGSPRPTLCRSIKNLDQLVNLHSPLCREAERQSEEKTSLGSEQYALMLCMSSGNRYMLYFIPQQQ